MSSNKVVTANYGASARWSLTVRSTGSVNVPIAANPATYAGTTNYSKPNIPNNAVILLTAPPARGAARFRNWTGCTSVTGRIYRVVMSANRTVTANYRSVNNNCPTQTRAWGSCSGIAQSGQNGIIRTVNNTRARYTGRANFRCTSGQWVLQQGSAVCRPQTQSQYYSENFDRYASNTLPAGWRIIWNGQGTSAQGVRSENNGNKYLRIAGQRSWSSVLTHEFRSSMPTRIQLSFRVRDISGTRNSFAIGNGSKAFGHSYRALRIPPNTWSNVRVDIDFNSNRGSIYVNGILVLRNHPTGPQSEGQWSPWRRGIPALVFWADNDTTTECHIDNIVISARP